jgi:hypothetical protein
VSEKKYSTCLRFNILRELKSNKASGCVLSSNCWYVTVDITNFHRSTTRQDYQLEVTPQLWSLQVNGKYWFLQGNIVHESITGLWSHRLAFQRRP